MKRQIAILLIFIFMSTFPVISFAFYSRGDINQYLSYDRLEIMTPQEYKIYHPRVKGRLINETNKQVYVYVDLYFCDISNKRYNQATISMTMDPKEKSAFENTLLASEWKYSKNAHHVEFKIKRLIVGGKNIKKF